MEPSLALAVLALFVAGSSAEIVQIKNYGAVDGSTVAVGYGKTVEVFRSIPYAKPPVESLRFKPPEKPDPWSGTRDATKQSAACIQGAKPPMGMFKQTTQFSEDCLYLNIFAPTNTSNGPYSVMVWFHGGNFKFGSSAQFPGHVLAGWQDTIVVVPNYRIGMFGFLQIPGKSIKGNMGLWDQVMVLQWVKENIADFGGDPDEVTIFGHGSGATCVQMHAVSPVSRGLFKRTIILSALGSMMDIPEKQDPEKFLHRIAYHLNCTDDSIAERIDCVLEAPLEAFKMAMKRKDEEDYNSEDDDGDDKMSMLDDFGPVIDGENGFLPKKMEDLEDDLPHDAYVPTLSGIAKNDASVLLRKMMEKNEEGKDDMDDVEFKDLVKRKFTYFMDDKKINPAQREIIFNAIALNYAPSEHFFDPERPFLTPSDVLMKQKKAKKRAFGELLNDFLYGMPWNAELEDRSEHKPTFGFVFDYSPEFQNGSRMGRLMTAMMECDDRKDRNDSMMGDREDDMMMKRMGASHGIQLAFVFGLPFIPEIPEVRADLGIDDDDDYTEWDERDKKYSKFMMAAFANFARESNPTPSPLNVPNSNETFTWPSFSKEEREVLIVRRDDFGIERGYRERNFQLFDNFTSSIIEFPQPVCQTTKVIFVEIWKFKPRKNKGNKSKRRNKKNRKNRRRG